MKADVDDDQVLKTGYESITRMLSLSSDYNIYDILDDCRVSYGAKMLIVHYIYEFNDTVFEKLLGVIWKIIANDNDMIKIFNEEIGETMCVCQSGRRIKLCNVCAGIHSDIIIGISQQEEMNNLAITARRKGKQWLRNQFESRGYTNVEMYIQNLY